MFPEETKKKLNHFWFSEIAFATLPHWAQLVKFVKVKIFDPYFCYLPLNFFQSQVLFISVINDKVNKNNCTWWFKILNLCAPINFLCWQSQISIMPFWPKIKDLRGPGRQLQKRTLSLSKLIAIEEGITIDNN
jgi:hypothetical protein